MKEIKNKSGRSALIPYFIVLITVWGAVELQIWPYLREINFFESELLSVIVKSGVVKSMVWTLPALLLIRCYESRLPLSVKAMFTNRISWRQHLPVFAFFTVFLLAASWVLNGNVAISANFTLSRVIISVFAGIAEEIVFRGWLLNAALPEGSLAASSEDAAAEIPGHLKKQIRIAVLGNSLLFLAIHFPRWIHEGIFLTSFLDLSFLCVIALSVIFSRAFIKSKSIFISMALHMYWDLLAFLLL